MPFIIQNEAVDVDIDEILDMDTDATRRSHLYVCISTLVFSAIISNPLLLQSILSSSSCKRSEKDISVSNV